MCTPTQSTQSFEKKKNSLNLKGELNFEKSEILIIPGYTSCIRDELMPFWEIYFILFQDK